MHLKAAHAERDIPTLRRFVEANSLGVLTTAVKCPGWPTIQASHIPWLIDVRDPSSDSQLPILRGHISRQNPQAKAIVEHLCSNPSPWPKSGSTSQRLQEEVMVLFNGPVNHYVTPKFYTGTKPKTGKVVPTWNYSAVQAYGIATVYVDPKAEESGSFLGQQINDLSHRCETNIMKFASPWKVSDAPTTYVELQTKSIMGIEIEITRMEGRFKWSQDKPKEDRDGVIAGFKAMGTQQGQLCAEAAKERSDWREEAEGKDTH